MTPPVVVAGEALVDLAPTNDAALAALPGGGPFNTARALGRLGQATTFLGGVSRDRLGRAIAAALASDGVALDSRLRTDSPTSLALAEIDASGAATYGFYLSGTSALELTPDLALQMLPQAVGALHVGSLGILLEPMASAAEALMKSVSGRAPVMLDPNVRPSMIRDLDGFRSRLVRLLGSADILKVSDADLETLAPDVPPLEAARAMLSHGPRLVLLTFGSRGAVAVHASGSITVTSPEVAVVDTIGAGDIFSGAWLARWIELGGSLEAEDIILQATDFACRAASWSCTRPGACPPTRAQLAATGAGSP